MALEFNSIGVTLNYKVATSASRPASGYTNIPDLKTIPGVELTPSKLEVTNLVDKYRRFITGVLDAGDSFDITANLTASLKSAWASLVSAANTAWASGFNTWFEIKIPNFDSFFFAGTPIELGLKGMDVDSVVEADGYVVPNQIIGWASSTTSVVSGSSFVTLSLSLNALRTSPLVNA